MASLAPLVSQQCIAGDVCAIVSLHAGSVSELVTAVSPLLARCLRAQNQAMQCMLMTEGGHDKIGAYQPVVSLRHLSIYSGPAQGPEGPKTLCNACGVKRCRQMRQLVEGRKPASSLAKQASTTLKKVSKG